MKRIAAIFALLLAVTVTAAASAGTLKGDPRVCIYNKPAQCAQEAATYTLIRYMRTHGQPGFAADIACTHGATLLRWTCTWPTSDPGRATVTFKGTPAGWQRVVTLA